ncbi:hypothetical protein [Verrucomicrobium sp. BvORR106]|uniref:hypothetical protein n=1 Tax=Verrucomicrobium sp. BvORR106 TaxID=1403819 RepID=UPI00068C4C13|nr:hypothetical protein [Verrucomicrobium sp. BvORR106]
MNTLTRLPLLATLALLAACPQLSAASAASPQVPSSAVEATGTPTKAEPAPALVTPDALAHLPGVGLAEGVSQITGTAVSPLLGVSAVGAWKYFATEEALRSRLPWYCHPGVWGSCFVMLGLCFLKDFLGAAAPPLVKKPLDFIELFEDKASALVASTAFVPLVAVAMAQMNAIPVQPEEAAHHAAAITQTAQMGFATLPVPGPALAATDLTWVKTALYIPVGFAIFVVVWLSSHAINVLIALSPFGIVDAALKVVKLGVLGLITASAFIHPALGLLVCLLVIVPACFIAGPAFRLMVFGNVFGLDLLLARKAAPTDVAEGVRAFNSSRIGGTPARTYGRLGRNAQGAAVFRYRPWLILPTRETAVAATPQPDGVAQGLIYPSLTRDDGSGKAKTSFVLLPRYRDCVTRITEHFGITKVTDSTLLRGFKAMRNWLVEALSFGRSPVPLPASGRQ